MSRNFFYSQIMEKTNNFLGVNAIQDSVSNKVALAVASCDHQESKLCTVVGMVGKNFYTLPFKF